MHTLVTIRIAMSAISQIYRLLLLNHGEQMASQSSSGLDVVPGLPLNGGHEEGSDAASVLLDSGDISVVLRDQQVSKNANMM